MTKTKFIEKGECYSTIDIAIKSHRTTWRKHIFLRAVNMKLSLRLTI